MNQVVLALIAQIARLESRVESLEEEKAGISCQVEELETRLQAQLDALITYTMFETNDVM